MFRLWKSSPDKADGSCAIGISVAIPFLALFLTLFLALILALGGCDRAPADAQSPTFVEFDQLDLADGQGVYTATRGTDRIVIPFAIDATAIDPARRHDSERIGASADGVVVMLDRYASKPRGDGRCVDGVESTVRAFSLRLKQQVFAAPAESCLNHLPALQPPATWIAPDRFRVRDAEYHIEGQRVMSQAAPTKE